MGVLNVTPDSFSDGGEFVDPDRAVRHALAMVEAGAAIIDVGGESTRPGSLRPSAEEECQRVVPVIEKLKAASNVIISVDTSEPLVMAQAAQAGAEIVNDVRGLCVADAMETCAAHHLAVAIMHMQGEPNTMQHNPHYADVVTEVLYYLKAQTARSVAAGISADSILWDPGFGFGKTFEHNRQLFKHLPRFAQQGVPLLVGVSRKSWVGHLTQQNDPKHRLSGSVALAAVAGLWGAAILRAHDVRETVDALKIAKALRD